MNHQPISLLGRIAAIAMVGWLFTSIPAAAVANDGYEVLTRGPVHEAFAGTVSYNAEPGIIIDTAPPEAIEELPPEHQLDGENVAWIPGYWAWEEEQNSFLWISGVWRNLPPGREWVPGYWNPVGSKYQWISGYWADVEAAQVAYLPAPPSSLEVGPSVTAVSTDQVWLPGSWIYQESRYAWRAGYWTTPREHWVYVPANYVWTPRGYIFVDGYWDHAIPRRGVVFAPIHFHRPIYASHGYRYSPTTVINLTVFLDHLFLRPSYRHYYFGDYYATSYRSRGYHASYSYHASRRGYDPIFAYQRWSNRNDRNWERNHRRQFDLRRDRESARPPRTWADMQRRPEYRERGRSLATPLNQYIANRPQSEQRFRRVDSSSRDRIVAQNRAVRNFGAERQRAEGRRGEAAARPTQATRENRTRSPIMNRSTARPRPDGPTQARTGPRSGTPDRVRPPTTDRNVQRPDRPATPADRPGRVERREDRPERAQPAQRGEQPQRVQPPQRTQPRPDRVQPPQRTQPRPERVQPPQRQPRQERVQPPQRTQPTPQRVQPQRQQPAPQRVQPPQRTQPTPQRVQPQRQQPAPQRVQPPQRQQRPERVQPQRPQPRPERAQPQQRQQPRPERAQPPQRQQQPQRAQPQRGGGGGRGEERGGRRER